MSDMSWEHASEARAALNAIVSDPEYGVAALSNAQTMSNLLKDYLPDAPREKSILVAAAEAGLADSLRDHVSQGMDPSTAIRLTASSFSSSTPFTPDACNWVTDEIAVALGISQGRSPGNDPFGGGQVGNQPPGYPSAGNEGTQMAGGAPGYPPGQPPNLGGGGYPQSPGQGFGAGQPGPQEQPTAQGYRPGYGPQGGGFGGGVAGGVGGAGAAPAGGFGQPGLPGQPGQPGGYPGQPTYPQPGGFGGQPGQPGQPGGFPGQPGYGAAQPPAYGGQPGQPGSPGGWTPGPYGGSPGGGYGGQQSSGGGGKKGLFIGGGIAAAVVIVLILVFALSGGKKHNNADKSHSPTPTHTTNTPTPTPTPTTPPSTGPEPLSTIMNPAGLKPVGTECTAALLFGLNKASIKTRTFCAKTTGKNIDVWGYQFLNKAGYTTGVAHINTYTGFTKSTSTCPPATDSEDGETGWHANNNPRYKARAGQNIECFLDNGKPVLIWTMPTQNVFFIAQYHVAGGTLSNIVSWWKTVNYG
ncbi:MAG TPA: hypothetical protein VGM14_03175 [Streptosporangiaceae bacterium]|jgi:hypothetical protein